MYEGKIIKFYRKKARLTQDQLGQGICSVTHISKIERGLTEYSPEITNMLAERLGIDMTDKLNKLSSLKKRLDQWHDAISSQRLDEAKAIKNELDQNNLIPISDYHLLYQLLIARYFLMVGDSPAANKQIKAIQKNYKKLPQFEDNLFKHVRGIYHLFIGEHFTAIDILRTIQPELYQNPKYYYHLAAAYHHIHSPVKAYYYAEKALQFFKRDNNFLDIIDAEMLMLIQVEVDKHRPFEETVEQYNRLLHSCDLCHSVDKKGKVLHNFAYEHLSRNNYKKAASLYKQSMDLKDKGTDIYLLSLEGYVRSCFFERLLSEEELLGMVHDGKSTASALNDDIYILLFNLLDYLIKGQKKRYHTYMKEKALPYVQSHGFIHITIQYQKELYRYYVETGQTELALEIADQIINRDDGDGREIKTKG
ncbi:helix-turn-helix protein [Scopulibacillus darangshiensis]|uniref:Helix-turn-helix protein n=1 Tax=Scopulibacillus darangshiensis TaxID=442528 RepID=A0A4R2P9B3_9BACL|nr:helix-turn-helix transcriptional regulator [Scopulibacillus darangshiensis]TCP30928.1 helix-turn-helix protein [Scopulibacillus darangshiensis]